MTERSHLEAAGRDRNSAGKWTAEKSLPSLKKTPLLSIKMLMCCKFHDVHMYSKD